MNVDHIKLQFRRLKRHHESCVADLDEISMLDLAHSLRIWSDMKNEIDEFIQANKLEIKLQNSSKTKAFKEILKGSSFVNIPIPNVPKTGFGKVTHVAVIHKKLTAKDAKAIYEKGISQVTNTDLTFVQWLGSEIFETKDKNGNRIGLPREIIIRRIANILGASHPHGTENSEEYEKKFDPYINELHHMKVADGYPVTYYKLMEIANDIIINFDKIFGK